MNSVHGRFQGRKQTLSILECVEVLHFPLHHYGIMVLSDLYLCVKMAVTY